MYYSSESDVVCRVFGVGRVGGGLSKLCFLFTFRFVGGELVIICVEMSNETEIVLVVLGILLFTSGNSWYCFGVSLCVSILLPLSLCRGRRVVCLLLLRDIVSISKV